MMKFAKNCMLAMFIIIVVAAPQFAAQPSHDNDNEFEDTDQNSRIPVVRKERHIASKPKWGFFGTIFHLILEQVNDTKSAYNQISDLINDQFADDNAVTMIPISTNGTTKAPKISRAEFLRILDRNLKGLARLRNLEWREAKKDSRANFQQYMDEIFGGKNTRKGG